MAINARWNTLGGSWFSAASWDVDNPNAPPPILHYVPGADNAVNIPDNSTVGTPFTITYNGTSTIYSLGGASNAAINMTGGTLTVLHGGFGLGRINVASGATLAVEDDSTNLAFNNGDFAGTLTGEGTLRWVNGTFNLNAGLSVTVANWLLTYQIGSGTVSTTNLNTDLSYARNFLLEDVSGNFPILNLNSHTLTLSGTATLDGVVQGTGTLRVTGSGSVAGGSFGSGTTLQVSGTLNQTGGYGLGGTLQVDAGATYAITSASNITGTGTPLVLNNGDFRVAGAGTSTVSSNFTNNGTITVAAGSVLNLNTGSEVLNGTITGAGSLNFGFAHNASLNTTTLNVGTIYVNGGNGGGTLALARNITYGGNFTFENQFGELDLNGHTLALTGSTTLSSGIVGGTGTLQLRGTTTIGSIGFGGNGTAVTVQNDGTATQISLISLKGSLVNNAGRTYTLANGSSITEAGNATTQNNGSLIVTGAGSSISGTFINAGTLSIVSGASLTLQGGSSRLEGTVAGAGTLNFGFAHNVRLDTTALNVATISINGGNGGGVVTMARDITYGGAFTFANAFGSFNLNGHTLTLNGGNKVFSGGTLSGDSSDQGTLRINNAATFSGFFTIGGSDSNGCTVVNAGIITQTGPITLNGDLQNLGTYSLNSGNIGGVGTFTNTGTLTVAPNQGGTDIAPTSTSTGTLTVVSGASLRLTGASTLGGTIGGAGTLILAGSATINAGAITTGALAFNSTTTLGVDLAYGGAFSIGIFSTTQLGGHTLTLSGAANLNTGFNTINNGTLRITGTTTLGGVSLGTGGGPLTLQNAGTINQVDSISLNGSIQNQAGRTYSLASANISGGASGSFSNAGTLAVNVGVGSTGDIGTNFTNTGTVSIANGVTLRLSGTSTLGGTVGGAGTLVLAGTAAVNGPISTGALAFNGVTALGANLNYAGNFSIGIFSTTNLNGRTLTLSGTSSFTSGFNTVNGAGSVVITGSATIGGVAFGNTAAAVTLRNSGTIEQIGGISLNGTFLNDAGRTILMSAASNITNLGNGGTLTNNGTFTKDGDTGTGTISTLFTNNGLVRVLEGTLDFQNFVHVGVIQGAISQTGNRTIVNADVAGELTLTGGTGNNRIAVTSAPTHVDGGAGTDTLVIGASMTLAAGSVVGVERFEVGNGVTANLSALSSGVSVTITSTAGGGSTVFGTKGADTIISGGGLDTMRGGLGNDVYSVNHAGDQVFEAAGQGTDRIASTVSYTLAAGQSVEGLYLSDAASVTALNLVGNELVQSLTGNAGNNILVGGAGADTLRGLAGDDTYSVDNVGDLVFEAAGGGTDRVSAAVSYTLAAGQSIESLYLTNAAAVTALNLTGNELAQSLTGNAGNNTLVGGGGADTMRGLGGNDAYSVDNAGDVIFEAAGQGTDRVSSAVSYTLTAGQSIESLYLTNAAATTALNLVGNELAQTLSGNAGNNLLDGKGGADTLRGYGGNDSFQFSTALGGGNVDHIADFSAVDDTIRLRQSVFTELGLGTMTGAAYKDIASGTVDADDRILYDHDTGQLFYDSNGSGAGGRFEFAVLDNKPATLTHVDFLIVA